MTKSRVITPGELEPGQHLTVLENKDDDTPSYDRPSRDYNLIGVPMKAVVVDLPFLLVQTPSGQKFTVDTRHYEMMEMNPAYYDALAPQAKSDNHGYSLDEVVSAHNSLAQIVRMHEDRFKEQKEQAKIAPAPPPQPPPKPSLWKRLFRR